MVLKGHNMINIEALGLGTSAWFINIILKHLLAFI